MSLQEFRTNLIQANQSIDAFVLVGGTLFVHCRELLQQASHNGMRKRVLYPYADSPWLVSYLTAIGIPHESYVGRMARNASLARRLGFDVRYHSHPVSSWYVIFDQARVFQKHIGILTSTTPEAVPLAEAGKQFSVIFDNLWNDARVTDSPPLFLEKHDSNRFSSIQRPLQPPPKLRIFLSYSSTDKPQVRPVYQRLCELGFTPWFDEIDLLPGHDFDFEIDRAVRASDIVIVCLSSTSTRRSGYLQKELRYALDIAERQPEGRIFLIPVLLEPCNPPRSLEHLQHVRLYEELGFDRLVDALLSRVEDAGPP